MEEEAEKLKEMQNEVEKSVLGSSSAGNQYHHILSLQSIL